jgi:hypothetical protein
MCWRFASAVFVVSSFVADQSSPVTLPHSPRADCPQRVRTRQVPLITSNRIGSARFGVSATLVRSRQKLHLP